MTTPTRRNWYTLLCALCLMLALPELCRAETDGNAKYKQMLATSEEMREADQSIKDTLAEAEKTLTPQDYKELLKIQDNWIKNEFLANVKAYAESGLSEAQAWAMEIGSHADSLAQAVEVLYLRRHGKGCEGVYEFNAGSKEMLRQGMLLVRLVDGSYSVSLDVTQGKPGAAETCNYSGEGELKGKVLHVSTEEEPEARLTITFEGPSAKVKATKAANALCGQGQTLDGAYAK